MNLINTAVSVERMNITTEAAPTRQSASASPLILPVVAGDQYGAVHHCPTDTACFVALSRFTVANMSDQVKQAFRQRPHRVDNAVGFVRMDVLSPLDSLDEIWLITYWKDEPSYRSWHHSHLYKESHQGIPAGLRLVPKSISIRFFEHVAS